MKASRHMLTSFDVEASLRLTRIRRLSLSLTLKREPVESRTDLNSCCCKRGFPAVAVDAIALAKGILVFALPLKFIN